MGTFRDVDGDNGASFSEDRVYRYLLRRTRAPDLFTPEGLLRTALFVMINPSDANETVEDPTSTKVKRFTELLGCRRHEIVNFFGLVSSNPAALRSARDPVGPDNDEAIATACARADVVVCAWGANARRKELRARVPVVKALLRAHVRSEASVIALRLLDDGVPEHPLFIPYAATPVPFVLHGDA